MAKRHSKFARNIETYSKNYGKLRKYAIKDNIRDEKEGRAFMDSMDALELVILSLSVRVLELEKKVGLRK